MGESIHSRMTAVAPRGLAVLGQEEENFGLEGVGVLEFVDQDVVEEAVV